MEDALQIKHLFWRTQYTIPNTRWTIRGFSRSAYRTGFYVPELDLMLDAGPQNFNKPSHILITHTHLDHIAGLPLSLIGDEAGDHMFHIHAPDACTPFIRNYIAATFSANVVRDASAQTDGWYTLTGHRPHTSLDITTKNTRLRVSVLECDHGVPTIGYGIAEIKQKLSAAYAGLEGHAIAALRKNGTIVTEDVVCPRFAYVCDTSIETFALNPTLLSTYPTVFIECTFFMPDEVDNAKRTKHVHWNDLKPLVVAHPHVTFILFHFSQRYRDAEIEAFFANERIANVHAWTMSLEMKAKI